MKRLAAFLLFLCLLLPMAGCGGTDLPEPTGRTEPTAVGEPEEMPAASDTSNDESGSEDQQAQLFNCSIDGIYAVITEPNRAENPGELVPGSEFTMLVDYIDGSFLPMEMLPCFGDNVYEGLLYWSADGAGQPEGCLAESWSASEDRLTWQFVIREGVLFSDGSPCGAQAICDWLDYCASRYPNLIAASDLASWEAEGEYTLTIVCRESDPEFENDLCRLKIASADAIKQYGERSLSAAVSTGPYYFAEFDKKTGVTMKANPWYSFAPKRPSIETVRIIPTGGEINAVSMLLAGEGDGALLSDARPLEEGNFSGTLWLYHGAVRTWWLNPSADEALYSKTVRRALCSLFDAEKINSAFFGGLGRVQKGIWAEDMPAYVPPANSYDPELAKTLLAEEGVTELTLTIDRKYFDDNFAPVREDYEDAGVKFNFLDLNPAQTTESSYSNPYSDMPLVASAYTTSVLLKAIPSMLMDHPFSRVCHQQLYDEALYEAIADAASRAGAAQTREELTGALTDFTALINEDALYLGGIALPRYLALSKGFRCGVLNLMYTTNDAIQYYSLRKQ